MDKIARQHEIKRHVGSMLAIPCFAAMLLSLEETSVDSTFEEIIAEVFFGKMKKSFVMTKNKKKTSTHLLSLAALCDQATFSGDESPAQSGKQKNTEEESSKDEIRGLKEQLIETVISDLNDIFQVNIENTDHLKVIYKQGVSLLRKFGVVGGMCGLFSLLPLVVVSAISCAMKVTKRLRLYHEGGEDLELFGEWVDSLLRVWLVSIDAIGINSDKEGNPFRGEGCVDRWVSYILAGRNVIQTCKNYLGTQLQHKSISTLTFEDVEYKDMTSVFAVLSSMKEECKYILKAYYNRFDDEPSFQRLQARQAAHQLSKKTSRLCAPGSEHQEMERMREALESCRSLFMGCDVFESECIMEDFRSYELSFRTNRFKRAEVYSLSCHPFVCVVVALLINSKYLRTTYESFVIGIVTSKLEEQLKGC